MAVNFKKIFIIAAVGSFLVLIATLFRYRLSETVPDKFVSGGAHFYNDPATDISNIRIKMFYVVPENKKEDIGSSWDDDLQVALAKSRDFHALQFRYASEMNYDIFPKPIILENNDLFYDTTSTASGNPHGLISVAQEIDRRVFNKNGDLYDPAFIGFDSNEFPVMGILYEGVGASGGPIYETSLSSTEEIAQKYDIPESMIYVVDISSVRGFFILNREYLTNAAYRIFGASVLYHEFSHTIGLGDRFDEHDIPTTNDITGAGRWEPIETAYIGRDLLQGLGVIAQ